VFDRLLKESLGATSGELWTSLKKPLMSFFSYRAGERNFMSVMEESDKWILNLGHKKILTINEMGLDDLSLNVLSRLVYGSIDKDDFVELKELSQIHSKLMKIMSTEMVSRIPLLHKLVGHETDALIGQFWSRWKTFNHKMKLKNKEPSDTLMSVMNQSEIYQNEQHMLHTLYEILLFNLDIMIDSFSHLIWNIATKKSVQQLIEDEIEKVGQIENIEDLDQLVYTSKVINESARLNPGVVFTFPETLTKSMKIGGFVLPKGTMISLDTKAINRDKSQWSDPDDFNPSRFDSMTGSVLGFHRFGLGSRKCLGNVYADMMLKICVFRLLSRYNLSMKDLDQKVVERDTITNLSSFDLVNEIVLHEK
jgi:cytochrome P450